VSVIGIGADVSDIAVGFGSIWVAGGNDSTLTRIDPKLNPPAVQATLRFGGASDLAPQPIFSVAAGTAGIWITRGNRLVLVDPGSDRAVASYAVPSPIALATGAGDVWLATQDERLLRYSAAGAQTGSLSLPSSGPVTFGDGALWAIVTLGSGAVWQIDPSSVTPIATLAVKGFPGDLAVGEGAVWTAGGDGTVVSIDPVRSEVRGMIRLGLPAAAVAAGEHGVWVAVQRPS
jgi:hypothetical protein